MIDYAREYTIPAGWSIEAVGSNRWHMRQLVDENAADIMYHGIAPGVLLLDIDLHCYDLPVFNAPSPSFLTVNWCEQGRCEAASPQRGSTVVDPGLICLSSETATTYSYPTGSYRGYELVADLELACADPDNPFARAGIDLRDVERRLCQSVFALTMEPPRACLHAMHAIADLLAEPDPDPTSLLLASCLMFSSLKGVDPAACRLTSSYLQKSQRELAQRLYDAIQANPTPQPPVAGIAATCGVSEASLRNYFSRTYGTTPAAFARSLALKRAAELLATTDQSVSDIALTCGYSNPSKFSSAFRKEFDINPLEYRRRERLKAQGPLHEQ